ncbi:salivary glue protein Sgs-3-like isoform X1 [Haliotis asinina]|uniref:salivary glue protein Sgs-3-like isoform X1 n=1 Tax=Haliotis asinina TaxID=109174 RepID=UPI0035325867
MSMLCGVMKSALILLALALSTGTSQAAVACQDHDVVCSTMEDVCSDPLGPTLCPETCHACPTEAVTMALDLCQDHHIACSTVVGICSHSFGPELCGKTCHACSSAPTSTQSTSAAITNPRAPSTAITTTSTAPSTAITKTETATSTATTTVSAWPSTATSTTSTTPPTTTTQTSPFTPSITTHAAPSTVNATTPTPSPTITATTSTAPSTATMPSIYGSSPSATSRTAASTTLDTAPPATTNTSSTTDNGTAATRTTGAQASEWSSNTVYSSVGVPTGIPTSKPTSGKVIERSCFQCGEETTGTYCTIMETIMPRPYPCPEDTRFCMTEVYQHIDTSTKYIRRCVDEATCNMQWYQQTSGNSECVGVDPTTLSSNVTCRYCCTTDNCNYGIIPNSNTLYKPQP